jgi:hypothetical protein|tara:strand:- start:179 stop:355 length:177 start_codon:yes stop_codon:yes gene_type:complete
MMIVLFCLVVGSLMYQTNGCCAIGIMLQASSKLRSIAAEVRRKLQANSELSSIAAQVQ